MKKDYFTDYIPGESYVYGLKCASGTFAHDERQIITVPAHTSREIVFVHKETSRYFLQIHLAEYASVSVHFTIKADTDQILDAFIEVFHQGNHSTSDVRVHGYVDGSSRVIVRLATYVPQEVFHTTSNQNVLVYQFSRSAEIDCIPTLQVQNKTSASRHAVAIKKITDIEYWNAGRSGLLVEEYQDLYKQSL